MNVSLDFFNFIRSFFKNYLDITMLIIGIIYLAVFLFFLILTIKRYKRRLKLYFITLLLLNFITAIIVGFTEDGKIINFFMNLSFTISVIFYLVIFVLSERKSIKKEEKRLIDLINVEYQKEQANSPIINEDLKKEDGLKEDEKRGLFFESDPILKDVKSKIKNQVEEDDICLEHAKNIVERLYTLNLSFYDKKVVKEIEYSLLLAEREGISNRTKFQINEGLQSLLKIMSKYQI